MNSKAKNKQPEFKLKVSAAVYELVKEG